MVRDHEVVGSSPVTSTIEKTADFCRRSFAMPVFKQVCRTLYVAKSYNYTQKQN